jgi:hypothetical protein
MMTDWPGFLRRIVAMASIVALSACALPSVTAPREVTVLGGEIRVKAPRFYCIDQESARASNDSAVVLIGRCTVQGHVSAALVTVTVGPFASAGVMLAGAETLRSYLRSPAGRKALSRSGKAGDVAVLGSGVVDGALLLHIDDRMAGSYWRAILGVKGRLVTVSASGAEDAPLTSEQGRALVDQTVAALIKANPATQR